jgi:hypothetical protein
MIPHRMLADDIFENGLRDRVSACRKRLRANRAPRKFPLGNQVDEVFPKATRGASEFSDYSPGHPTTRQMSVCCDHHSSPHQGAHREEDSEMLVQVGEPEVGIT